MKVNKYNTLFSWRGQAWPVDNTLGVNTNFYRDIDIAVILSVRPSVRLSLCLSVRHVPVFYGNGLTYCHRFFTTW